MRKEGQNCAKYDWNLPCCFGEEHSKLKVNVHILTI